MADQYDGVEPGQDDLMKEDSLAKSMARKAKRLPKTLSGNEENIYTDHKVASLDDFTPDAERQRPAEGPGTPIRTNPFLDKLKALFTRR